VACRRVVTARQQRAAQLLLDGESAYRALMAAGYSRWTARNFGALLRSSWGLREAIRREQESRKHYFRPASARRRRYDRRAIANAVLNYCGSEDRQAVTNAGSHWLHEQGRKAMTIAESKLWLPARCSICGGATEGNDHWCPRCQRIEML